MHRVQSLYTPVGVHFHCMDTLRHAQGVFGCWLVYVLHTHTKVPTLKDRSTLKGRGQRLLDGPAPRDSHCPVAFVCHQALTQEEKLEAKPCLLPQCNALECQPC